MAEGGSSALFVGDLSDPWVEAMASALPAGSDRLDCPEFLPEVWPLEALRAPVVILHRAFLSNTDTERLRALRSRPSGPPRIVLCVGPQVRAFQVERWRPLVDVILPEATASEVLARHACPPDAFAPLRDRERCRPRIVVVSTNYELRLTLADSCQRAGYPAQPVPTWAEAPPAWPAIWDVPVLEPTWPDQLRLSAADRRILTLIPFADRDLVSLARSLGAAACLELPFDPDDLAFVLDRMTGKARPVVDLAHQVPPAPAGLFRRASAVVDLDRQT